MNAQSKVKEANDNLSLWNAVAKTNPAYTKRVNQRGGFTAISAHYQVLEATEQFGPIGIGWGYEAGAPYFAEGIIFVPVTIWHGSRDRTFGPILGGAEWKDAKGRVDSDAGKKATTDALTKGLSLLGFNADVFLGRFDDNKYVEQVTAEFAANDEPHEEPAAREKLEGKHSSKSKLKAALMECHGKIAAATSTREIDAIVKEYAADIEQGVRYLPKWIDGDPALDGAKGLTKSVEDRREMVGLVESMQSTETRAALTNWMSAAEAQIDGLGDAERREFEKYYDAHEAGLLAAARVNAG